MIICLHLSGVLYHAELKTVSSKSNVWKGVIGRYSVDKSNTEMCFSWVLGLTHCFLLPAAVAFEHCTWGLFVCLLFVMTSMWSVCLISIVVIKFNLFRMDLFNPCCPLFSLVKTWHFTWFYVFPTSNPDIAQTHEVLRTVIC